jgi:apolipoprotein N-acyltransferase
MHVPLILRSQGWTGRALGLILGAIAVLGHAPFHFWPVTIVSFAILFARLQWVAETERPRRQGFSVALWWAVGYFAAGTFWVGSAFIERGPEFIPVMPFMVAGLAFLLAVFWALAGAFFARARLSGVLAVLTFTAAFTLAEIARGNAFGGFPWNLPAYIFEAGSRPSQVARWIGAYGLSALVLFVSAALGQAIFWRKRIWPIAVAVLPLLAIFGIGHVRLASAQLEFHDDVNLRIVSVPFKQSEMMSPDTAIGITNQFIRASISPGIKDVTHVIWPEGAVRGFGGPAMDDPDLLNAMGSLLSDGDTTPPVWLMNSLQTEMEQGRLRYYNASVAITFDENGVPAVAGSNRKHKLVAFGEHIPLMDWFEDVQFPLISTNLASISPAKTKTLIDFPGLPRVSPQLCYEVAFAGLTPTDDKNPAQFILNQSNDAWFGRSAGPAQHANIARYRAIETGLPIVRAASNGISGVFDPYGRIHGEVVGPDVSYIDTTLIKPLKFNGKIKLIEILLLLISLSTCVISSLIGRRGVGLRY